MATSHMLPTIDSLDVAGKRVLVRVDFNVPLDAGKVTDDTRIRAALPTVEHLLGKGAALILVTHLGRPTKNEYEEAFSTKPVAQHLAQMLQGKAQVHYVRDIVGSEAQEAARSLCPGEILVLENVRFDPREKQGDEQFAQELSALADCYVNDAFGTAHRAHASVCAVAKYLPSAAGYLLEREVATLSSLLENPKRPYMAILGGSKVSDKIGVIEALLDRVDVLVIGGAMCFTFLRAQGYETGVSLVEEDWISRCQDLIERAKQQQVDLVIPVDVVEADRFAPDASSRMVSVDQIDASMMGLDIGEKTVALIAEHISQAQTVFWNGPMGVFEMEAFSHGTRAVAQALANSDALTIIGGGDSVAAVEKFNVADQMSYISTGGGASMKLIEGGRMPALEALMQGARTQEV